jgi:putative sterol carrier protein
VRVADGVATVTEGDEGERRDATITCESYEFLRLATGHLSAITGVLRGQLKVKGDRAKALQLSTVLKIPKPRG